MRFAPLTAIAATFVLAGCFEEASLPGTLMFPPGLDITYQGKPAKLYGTSQCAQGQLTGNSCLIFPPHQPSATGVILTEQRVYQVQLTARQDPKNPVLFIVEDEQARRILSTTGRHDEYGNIDIRPDI